MSVADSLQLLDWTARQTAPGKRGSMPPDAPPVLERLKLSPPVWCALWSATLLVCFRSWLVIRGSSIARAAIAPVAAST
jgi:hypothetical protein